MKSYHSIRTAFIGSVLLCLMVLRVSMLGQGQVPELMSYQGYLVDNAGDPLGNPDPADYLVTFRIFKSPDSEALADLLWAETQTVTMDKGYFSVLLGQGTQVGDEPHPTLSSVFLGENSNERFVGISVQENSQSAAEEIRPRLRLLSSPYSFKTKNAENATNASHAGRSEELVSATGDSLIRSEGSNVFVGRPLDPSQQIFYGPDAEVLNVNGNVRAEGFLGNGSGLTSLNAGSISGKLNSAVMPDGMSVNSLTVSGTVTAGRFHGWGSVPVGGIIMWSGHGQNLNGSAWALCNGATVTFEFEDGTRETRAVPDLRGRFIMGANNIADTGNTNEIGYQGGANQVKLNEGNIPAHHHAVKDSYALLPHSEPHSLSAYAFDGIETVFTPDNKDLAGQDWGVHEQKYLRYLYRNTVTTSAGSANPVPLENRPDFYTLGYIIRYR